MTLRELAKSSDLSDAYLSRVENHKAAIPIANLSRLAAALNVSLPAFFDEQKATRPLAICRAGDGVRGRIRGPKGFLFELLAAEKKGKLMEPLVAELTWGKSHAPIKGHAGEEFDYVIEGACRFFYGKEEIELHEGDSVYYDATVPHAARPLRGRSCRILAVVASRDYLFHGDLTRLLNEGGK